MENLEKSDGGEVTHGLILAKDVGDWETRTSWGNTVHV